MRGDLLIFCEVCAKLSILNVLRCRYDGPDVYFTYVYNELTRKARSITLLYIYIFICIHISIYIYLFLFSMYVYVDKHA